MTYLNAMRMALEAMDMAREYVQDAIYEYESLSYHKPARLLAMKEDLRFIEDSMFHLVDTISREAAKESEK